MSNIILKTIAHKNVIKSPYQWPLPQNANHFPRLVTFTQAIERTLETRKFHWSSCSHLRPLPAGAFEISLTFPQPGALEFIPIFTRLRRCCVVFLEKKSYDPPHRAPSWRFACSWREIFTKLRLEPAPYFTVFEIQRPAFFVVSASPTGVAAPPACQIHLPPPGARKFPRY